MYTVVLYVTLCLGGTEECRAQEPITWTADDVVLQETIQTCTELAESVTVEAGVNTVTAECHVIGHDERDRHADDTPQGEQP